MRMKRWAIILFAGLSLPLWAQEPAPKTDDTSATRAAVEKLDLDIAKMLAAGNWEQYGTQLSEDFVRTAANGTVEHKQQAWIEFRTGNNKMLDMIPEELQVATYGDTAVVVSHVTILGRQNGKITTTFSRFTDVFVQRDGKWFMVSSQATPVAK